jgi:uncharacterized protein (TIGR02118 family)
MIKVSVMYPSGQDTSFDVDYYKNTHLPMIEKALGSALKGLELQIGIGGRVPGEAAPYVAIAVLAFDSVASFQTAFAPHAQVFADDVVNYTNIVAELQISEIL